MRVNSVVAALAAAFFGVTSAQAAPLVTYSDFGTWSAAVSTNTATVTIPNPLVDGHDYFGTGTASVQFAGVTFSTNGNLSNGNFFNVGPSYIDGDGSPPVLSSQGQSFGQSNLLITFLAPTTAFSLNYGTFFGSDVTFLLSNGDTFVQHSSEDLGYAASGFAGATASPFTWVLVTSDDVVLNVNNLVYSVPESSTWAMMILGFMGIAILARRRSSSRAFATTDQFGL
jgi:hypothetical protein